MLLLVSARGLKIICHNRSLVAVNLGTSHTLYCLMMHLPHALECRPWGRGATSAVGSGCLFAVESGSIQLPHASSRLLEAPPSCTHSIT